MGTTQLQLALRQMRVISRKEAKVVAILLGQLNQTTAQCPGRLLDKLLKIDYLPSACGPATLSDRGCGHGTQGGMGTGIGNQAKDSS